MEHLQDSGSAGPVSMSPQFSTQEGAAELIQHKYVKKDLTRVIVLVSALLAIIIGLMLIDRSSDKVQLIAEKITSLVIKQ